MLSADYRTTNYNPACKRCVDSLLILHWDHKPPNLSVSVSIHTKQKTSYGHGGQFTNSPPKRAITSMMIHVPRRPTEGFTPARMAKATAVGTAVSPVVIPASHSTRLLLTHWNVLWKVLSRQLNGTGHPQDLAQLYGSSSVRCSGQWVTQREQSCRIHLVLDSSTPKKARDETNCRKAYRRSITVLVISSGYCKTTLPDVLLLLHFVQVVHILYVCM